jgi:hypothetical protein
VALPKILNHEPGGGVYTGSGEGLPTQAPKQQNVGTHVQSIDPWWQATAHKTLDDPVALFTLGLFLATSGLWFFTARLWRATVRLSEDAKATGTDQADKMERSIAEAARSAFAMEGVANSMAINVNKITESVEISRAIARQQEVFSQAQMRAYIAVLIGGALYQTDRLNFEASPVILNTGNTPARNLRYRINADILPTILPDDFRFPLPPRLANGGNNILGSQRDGTICAMVGRRVPPEQVSDIKAGIGQSLYVWGAIRYEDIFGKTHTCTFAQRLFWEQSGPVTEKGEIPEIIRGWHIHKHNRAN